MGIQGLLPFLKKASRAAHLRDFKGQTAAVDAYCWLHKGAFSCADKLVRGESTDGYVLYVMKLISLLLNNNIKPVMVFDGCHLPSKSVTELKRRENRERNRKKAKELLREGKAREARECFQRCVEVTSEMASDVIHACRARNVDIIVAPYEADAQLAYLNKCGIAQLVITEDSDLVLFGCKAILFKLDNNGGCVLVEQEKLHLCMNVPRDKFSFDKFRNMCILSGCDYLPSLHGIGLVKACKFFTVTSNPDVHSALCKIPSYLKMPQLEVTKEYRDGFVQALNTFLYQLVFDPVARELRPLTDYPDDLGPDSFPYAGKFIGHERALQIALGNVNVQTGNVVDNFSPETYKPPPPKSSGWSKHGDLSSAHPSIWKEGFAPLKGPVVPSLSTSDKPVTKGKQVIVTAPIFKKRISEPEMMDGALTEGELHDLYCIPKKRQRRSSTSSDTAGEHQGDGENTTSLDKLCEELNTEGEDSGVHSSVLGEDNSDVKAGQESPVHSTTLPRQLDSKNPFAKSQVVTKSEVPGAAGSRFSALNKFNKIKKTVVDPNIIIHSRYFGSPAVKTSPTSHDSGKPVDNSRTLESEAPESRSVFVNLENSGKEGEKDEKRDDTLEVKVKPDDDDDSKTTKAPLSPVLTNTLPAKPTKTFQWDQLSDMFGYSKDKNVKIESSPAAKRAFKFVGQQKCSPSSKENFLRSSQDSDGEAVSSQRSGVSDVSLYSDVGSIDNESFSMTPAGSCPSTPDVTSTLGLTPDEPLTPGLTTEAVTPSPVTSPTTGQRSGSLAKCRTPGLSRHSNVKKKKPMTKQLSLKDMFGFKKEGPKLQPSTSSV